MEIRVTVVSTNRRGEQRDQQRVAGPVVNIGRGSQSQIHLPDARIALNHARIAVTEAGATIEAVGGRVEVNGRQVDSARLSVGDAVEIGPYDILIEAPPEGVPLALTIHLRSRFQPRARDALRTVLRRAPRVSRRRLSYLAFVGVLLLFLVIPLVPDLMNKAGPDEPPLKLTLLNEIVPAAAVGLMQTWNPGPVSRSHQLFGADCRTCHQYPFIQVRDSACVACHKDIKEHVPRAQLTGELGKDFLEQRCAECHRDHKATQLAPRSQELCVSCHANVKAAAPEAQSGNVTDFSRGKHPEFRLSLLDADRPELIRRVRQSERPPAGMIERSNLRFNHAFHLNARGVRDPENGYSVLKCADCHEPAEGGRLMAPITMERHCQRCHLLEFEPAVTKRQVPHGSEEAVMTTLREFYARLVLGDVPPDAKPPVDLPRLRPGTETDYRERQQALRIADERAQRVLQELYETPRNVCLMCHYIERESGGKWKVAPVRLARVWMPQGLFTHAKHTAQRCETCHDVTLSRDAGDIAMPRIEKCQQCHVGTRPVEERVTSDCAACHRFHAGREDWHKDLQAQMKTRGRK